METEFLIEDGVLVKYVGNATDAVIPDGVHTVGTYAFEKCETLVRVVLPDGVREIGRRAFMGCKCLAEVILPDSVCEIGESAFALCEALTRVRLPAGVTEIPPLLFQSCTRLEEVTLPAGLTGIGEEAFFFCDHLSRLALPEGLTEIGARALYHCEALESLALPASLASLGHLAVAGCSSLASLTVEEGNPAYRAEGNCLIAREGECLIAGCTASVIPDGVRAVADAAFFGQAPREVHLPASVTSVGVGVFRESTSLACITVAEENPAYRAEGNCLIAREGERLIAGCAASVIPDGVRAVAEAAFFGCEGLCALSLPASVQSVAAGAFSGCSSLASLTVAEENPVYYAEGNCLISRESGTLVLGCAASVIPDGVTGIGQEAFAGHSRLESLAIPPSVTEIGEWAFFGCTSLACVEIPPSVTKIGWWAFFACEHLSLRVAKGSYAAEYAAECAVTYGVRAEVTETDAEAH